jgi:hypothetical protein
MHGLRNRCLNRLVALIATLTLTVLPLQSYARVVDEDPTALEMMFDGLVSRPITLIATIGGAAIWAVTLPFSLLGGNAGEAADKLILYPAKATFVRCLGCKNPGRKVDYADELEDLDEDTYGDDPVTGESETPDTDPYNAESQEDFAADLQRAPVDSTTLSYDETGEDQIFEEAIDDADESFFELEEETVAPTEPSIDAPDTGFSDDELEQGFIFEEETTTDDIEDYGF